MLMPYIQPTDTTSFNRPLSEYIQSSLKRDAEKSKELYDFIESINEPKLTESSREVLDAENSTINYSQTSPTQIANFSNEYISLNTKGMIANIQQELSEWIDKGTENSYTHILSIKQQLVKYETYLVSRTENRLLLAALELIFKNNQWDKIPVSKLKFLMLGLERFSNGDVKNSQLTTFLREMHGGSITPLADIAYEKEKKAENKSTK